MDTGRTTTGQRRFLPTDRCSVSAVAMLLVTAALGILPAYALSEIKRNEIPHDGQSDKNGNPAAPRIDAIPIPLPDPIIDPDSAEDVAPGGGTVVRPTPSANPDAELPEIRYDTSDLPDDVRRMRELIIEACRAGDIEALRPLLGSGPDGTQLTFAGVVEDPIKTLRSFSGDDQGHEIMAILLEVLEAGYVHLDSGEATELYVWPYFFAMPLERLSNPQRIELFKILTAGDFEDMKSFGAYIFYRVGITPEGRWLFFVAGD